MRACSRDERSAPRRERKCNPWLQHPMMPLMAPETRRRTRHARGNSCTTARFVIVKRRTGRRPPSAVTRPRRRLTGTTAGPHRSATRPDRLQAISRDTDCVELCGFSGAASAARRCSTPGPLTRLSSCGPPPAAFAAGLLLLRGGAALRAVAAGAALLPASLRGTGRIGDTCRPLFGSVSIESRGRRAAIVGSIITGPRDPTSRTLKQAFR